MYKVNVDMVKKNLTIKPDEALILFFGSIKYSANRIAVETIINHILPMLESRDLKFKIVIAGLGGGEFQKRHKTDHPRLLFTGFIENIIPVIKGAETVIAPLSAGSGTRLKIIESIACGKSVVSTSIGAEGLNHSAIGEQMIIRDEWPAFTDAIVDIIKQRPFFQPSQEFTSKYDWNNIVGRLSIE